MFKKRLKENPYKKGDRVMIRSKSLPGIFKIKKVRGDAVNIISFYTNNDYGWAHYQKVKLLCRLGEYDAFGISNKV